jgi:hypothetical protein
MHVTLIRYLEQKRMGMAKDGIFVFDSGTLGLRYEIG